MGEYTQGFRAAMVRRMIGPGAVSATGLHVETGVAQSTLSRWLRDAGSVNEVSKRSVKKARRASRWSATEKLRIIAAAAELDGEELGALLRREGILQAQLDEWRAAAEQALDANAAAKVEAAHARELAELRKELARKEKALAETAARLVLRKKLAALWGDEDDDTTPPSEPSSSPRSRKP
jgi:transposase-like protein